MKEFYTVTEVAELFSVSKDKIRAEVRNGVIKSTKIGKVYRVPFSEVERIKREGV